MTKRKKKVSDNPWKISTFIFAVLLLVAAFNGGFDFSKGAAELGKKVPVDDVAEPDSGAEVPSDGKVTILEFSDFECPFCSRVVPTMEQVKETYGDKVEIIFKQFPLNFHQNAQKAAEASECARDQGKFWEYHDVLFENQRALKVADLKKYAVDLELDTATFDSCLDDGVKEQKVKDDMAEGQKSGITGTPGFLINGVKLSGAQPFEAFKQAIDAALSGDAPTGDAEPAAPPEVDTSNDPEMEFTVVNDPDCAACDSARIVAITKELFPTATLVELDYSSTEGKALLEDVDGIALPTFIFDSNVVDAANYDKVSGALEKKGDLFVIQAAAAGGGKFLNPPSADDDAFKGDADAPVTIIEFSDYQCPFCTKFYTDTLPSLEKEYIETGKVKFVYRDLALSFHAQAQKAAEAAECAGDQGKYWEMHNKLFDNQAALSEDNYKSWAADLGLDTSEFDDCLDTGKHEQEVKDDAADAAKVGATGTPAFFVNGIKVSGAQPFENFKAIIDAELGN